VEAVTQGYLHLAIKFLNIKKMKRIISKIKKLTQDNYHTESVMELAKFMNDARSLDQLKFIQSEQEKAGHLNQDLYSARMSIMKSLLDKVKTVHGEKVYQQFYQSF